VAEEGSKPILVECGPHKLELKPLEKMTADELREECLVWRNMFLNMDDASRFLLWLVNKEAVIVTRRYETWQAVIAKVEFEPRALYVLRTARRYDPFADVYRVEHVLERLDWSLVLTIQEVLERVGVQSPMGGPVQPEGATAPESDISGEESE
jgi:hypothetical protein